jgi:hypothetical protein
MKHMTRFYIALGMALAGGCAYAQRVFPLVAQHLGKGFESYTPRVRDGVRTLFEYGEGEVLVRYVAYDPRQDARLLERPWDVRDGASILRYEFEQRCYCVYDCCAHFNGGLVRAWPAEDGIWYGVVRLAMNV